MPDNKLEYPGPDGSPDWSSLYRARGEEVSENRPIFTGDVFFGVEVQGIDGKVVKNVAILQHPCALRTNGVDLVPQLIAVEICSSSLIPQMGWKGNYKIMPLPEVSGGDDGHCVAKFIWPYLASAHQLDTARRVACLSQKGVNLLLQRWVFHNSRVVVPTWKYQDVTSPQFEEADLIEEWCDERVGAEIAVADAAKECHEWLRGTSGSGSTWQELLEEPQNRSAVRKSMRDKLRVLR